jgi:hypothetical protein
VATPDQPQERAEREARGGKREARESREGTMQTAGLSGPAKKPKGGTDLRIEDGADKGDGCEAHERTSNGAHKSLGAQALGAQAMGRASIGRRSYWAHKSLGA